MSDLGIRGRDLPGRGFLPDSRGLFQRILKPGDPLEERDRNDIHHRADGAIVSPLGADDSHGRPGHREDATSLAFVVELARDGTEAGAFCGRVRHLTTLDGGNFTSAESLVAIMRRVIARYSRDELDE